MAERGILFSAPMVRALLAGTKTQTRRLLKRPDERDTFARKEGIFSWWRPYDSDDALQGNGEPRPLYGIKSPYGVPRDHLWVRETWMELYHSGGGHLTCLPPSGDDQRVALRRAKYRADGEKPEGFAASWRPSIYMPRWASRITLEITEVRVQRLQAITEEDAKAEGVEPAPFCKAGRPNGLEHVDSFEVLWDAINYKKAPWSSNPFVWVISFKRVESAGLSEVSHVA